MLHVVPVAKGSNFTFTKLEFTSLILSKRYDQSLLVKTGEEEYHIVSFSSERL